MFKHFTIRRISGSHYRIEVVCKLCGKLTHASGFGPHQEPLNLHDVVTAAFVHMSDTHPDP